MIQATELRIGNIVHATEAGRDGNLVEKIIESGVDIDNAHWYFEIPLTEEWVHKLDESEFEFCGFGTRVIYECVKFPAIKYEFTSNSAAVYFNDEMINIKEYVHEWQNIHYALTGQELTVK